MARFDFRVLGEKVVNGGRYYLVQGKARKSTDDPKAMIGWIDYDRGLVIDAAMQYAAGTIDLTQSYTLINWEFALNRAVCAGRMTLAAAQHKITDPSVWSQTP